MKEMVSEVAGDKKQLDFDQFYDIVSQLDEIAEGAEEEDDETIEEVTRELFDELRGKNDQVSISAFKAWDDVKALTEAGLMSEAALNDAITSVLAGKKQINFENFVELINQLDELSDETEEVFDEADDDEDVDTKEDDDDENDDEDLEEVARELFDELRGKDKKVSVAAFMAWEDVKDMIKDGLLTKDEIKEIVSGVAGDKKQLDFEQFYDIVSQLDELAEGGDEEDDITDDENDDESMEEVAKELFDELRGKNAGVTKAEFKAWDDVKEMLDDKLFTEDLLDEKINAVLAKKSTMNFEQFFKLVTSLDEIAQEAQQKLDDESDDDEDVDTKEDEDDEDDDEDLEEVARELFDELRGKDKKVSVAAFMAWEDVKDMIKDGLLTKDEIKEIVSGVAGDKKQLDFEQFYDIVSQLDELAEGGDEEDDITDDENDDESMEEDELTEEDLKEMAKELFDELRGKDKKVSIAAFMAWGDVKDMIEDGLLTKDEIKEIVSEVAGDKKQLDFDQFYDIVSQLDEIAEDAEDDLTDDEDEDELTEEDLKEVAKELFDELRGKDKKVSIAAFMASEDVKDMIEDGLLTKEQMKEMVSEVAGDKKQLDFEQFYDIVSQLDEIAEGAEDEDDLTDDEAEVQVESLESTKGFGSKTALSSKPIPLTAQNSASDEDDEFDGDFEDMSEEEVDEMLREVFDELKGKKGKTLTMKAFKKWEDIEEMLGTGIIDVQTIDDLAEKVGVKKGGDISYEQFKALVELLDEVAGEDDDSEEMSPTDERINDEDERIELDSNDIGGDGTGEDDEMTAEEIESMMKDIFNTLRGSKKTVSVATFLTWDNIQDMKDVIDDETINILLEEVGANRNRKGDLTYTQFSDLINLLEETVSALGDGEGIDTIMDDEDMDDEDEASAANVSATLEEREAIDAEISEERNERNVLDGIDDEGVDIIAKQIYESLKGESESLSVKAFLEWEDVSELIDQGIVKLSTVNLLIVEVGGAKTQTLTFDQFWQLVNLLEDASDAAADKVASGLDDSEDFDEDELEPSPEELEMMAKGIFDDLKNPKTGTVTAKKLKNWEGIKEVLDSGELSKGALNAAIKTVGAEKTNELDFKQFKELMDILEAAMDEGEMDEEPTEPVINASGKGFARAAEPAPVAAAMAAPVKAKNVPVPAAKAEKESEASMITREIYEELVGTGKSLSVDQLREWEDMQEMIEDGSLKRSTLEKALVKIGSLATGDISLKQFMQLIDIIQGAVDDSNLKFEYEDDVKDKDFKTSKKSSVLGSEDEEEENWGDDESGGDFEELTEEEAAQQAFDELVAEGASTISLVDFLQWEDVQDLLEAGALSKDDLATAIENAGVSLELDGIAFDKVTFYFTVAIPTYCC